MKNNMNTGACDKITKNLVANQLELARIVLENMTPFATVFATSLK